jgi:RNA polymerase sigma-70 factor (ECF subfamily)
MTWVSARYAQLIKLCRARGCSREVAKEIVQEAYLRLFDYQRSAKVKDAESLLRRITLTLAINYFQRELPKALATTRIGKLDHRGSLIDPAAGPEQTLAAEQELNGVVSLLSAVSRRTCQIFIAQRSGYSYEEIASAFAVKPRTIEKHVASAMVALQEMMPAAFSVSADSG